MSGGHFDYKQSHIDEIADSIEREIRYSEAGIECWSAEREYGVPLRPGDSEWIYTSWKDDKRYRVPEKNIINRGPFYYGDDSNGVPIFDKPPGWNLYPPEVLEILKDGVKKLREAAVFAQRIDWFLSGDDGEESLIERLKEDLGKVKRKIKELDDNNWNIGVLDEEDED